MTRHSTQKALGALVVSLATIHCGGSPDELPPFLNDSRYRPAPNEQAMDEALACDRLRQSLVTRARALDCNIEVVTCPELIRTALGGVCTEYDEGTISGCAAYFQQTPQCDDLELDRCVFAPLGDTCN